jgi:hypothetical protein
MKDFLILAEHLEVLFGDYPELVTRSEQDYPEGIVRHPRMEAELTLQYTDGTLTCKIFIPQNKHNRYDIIGCPRPIHNSFDKIKNLLFWWKSTFNLRCNLLLCRRGYNINSPQEDSERLSNADSIFDIQVNVKDATRLYFNAKVGECEFEIKCTYTISEIHCVHVFYKDSLLVYYKIAFLDIIDLLDALFPISARREAKLNQFTL